MSASQYASTQPQGYSNQIRSVALIGATGQQGKRILAELLAQGSRFNINVLTRAGSNLDLDPSVKVHEVDYDKHETLVSALQGIDSLVITMAVTVPSEVTFKLLKAAAEAKVQWILPNEWTTSGDQPQLEKDIGTYDRLNPIRDEIVKLGLNFVAFSTSFWYEYSLGIGVETYGFDFGTNTVTFFDKGEEKVNTSTWAQVARGVVQLLKLPILPQDEKDTQPTISKWRNNFIHISSFCLTQKDMFESVKRVTNTTDKDWTIKYETSEERVKSGIEDMQNGKFVGFMRKMYSRVFYPTGEGNFESKLANEELGLPKEDLDAATKVAVERFHKGGIAYRD